VTLFVDLIGGALTAAFDHPPRVVHVMPAPKPSGLAAAPMSDSRRNRRRDPMRALPL